MRLQKALSVFEVNGRQHAIVGVLALGVIEYLDIFEDVLPCDLTGCVGFTSDPFTLQQSEKALKQCRRGLPSGLCGSQNYPRPGRADRRGVCDSHRPCRYLPKPDGSAPSDAHPQSPACIPGDTWFGFTPTGEGSGAHAKCQSTVQRQFGSGYVVEYVTKQLERPNTGYAESEEYKQELRVHEGLKGRLVKLHKLRATARPLEQILGVDGFKLIQDMWSRNRTRNRWSVAFPIVQSFNIVGTPEANVIFGEQLVKSLLHHPSATLRPLSDEHRHCIANLELVEQLANNSWIALEDEFEMAERSEINPRTTKLISGDLGAMARPMSDAQRFGVEPRGLAINSFVSARNLDF